MMIRKILIMLCAVMCTMACSEDDSDTFFVQGDSTSQCTLIYFAGTSLKSAFNNNIEDIKSAVARGELGSNGRILYYMKSTSSVSGLYEIYKSGSSSVEKEIKTYNDLNWNESTSLAEVIADVKAVTGSAGTMNLIVSGHGTGWVTKEHPSLTKIIAGEVSFESMWEPNASALPTRFLGSSSDGYMDIEELQLGIEESNTKFGYLLFDACLMSSIETLYRLRDCADYIIASPAEIMAYGFPYDNILQYMFEDDGSTFDVEMICKEYYNFYASYKTPYGTIAACVTSELDGLAKAISELNLEELNTSKTLTLQIYEGLYTHVFYDLGNYISTATTDDLTQYNTAFDKAFPPECRWHTNNFYSALGSYGVKSITSYSGVSTSAPCTLFQDDWNNEPWTQAIGQSNE